MAYLSVEQLGQVMTSIREEVTAAVNTRINVAEVNMEAKVMMMIRERVAEIGAKLKVLEDMTDRTKEKSDSQRGPQRMTDRRAFSTLPKYSGQKSEYDNWKYNVQGFLEEQPEFVSFLKFIETHDKRKQRLDSGDVKKYEDKMEDERAKNVPVDANRGETVSVEWMNRNLWQVLRLNLTGTAQALMKTLNDDDVGVRGINAWRMIISDAVGLSGQRYAGLVQRVFSPKRLAKDDDLEAGVANWKTLLQEYIAVHGDVQDDIKAHSLKQLFPEGLVGDIRRMENGKTFKEVHEYVMNQISERKDPHFEKPGTADKEWLHSKLKAMFTDTQELAKEESCEEQQGQQCSPCGDVDEDFLMAFKGFMGKGVGKGGKGFQGACNHCGKKGHKWAECRNRLAGHPPAQPGPKGAAKGGGKGGKGNGGKGLYNWMDQVTGMVSSNVSPTTDNQGAGAAGWAWNLHEVMPKEIKLANQFDVLSGSPECEYPLEDIGYEPYPKSFPPGLSGDNELVKKKKSRR